MQRETRHARGWGAGYRQPNEPENYYFHHDAEGTARLGATVAHALADVMGRDVTEAEDAIAETIDLSALDRLFVGAAASGVAGGHLAFAVDGYRVTVYRSGDIVVTPAASDRPANPA